MLWRRALLEPRGRPRRSLPRRLHPPTPRRPGRHPAAQWQAPTKPTDDDRYSLFPPFFLCEGSLAGTLFFVERALSPRRARNVAIRATSYVHGKESEQQCGGYPETLDTRTRRRGKKASAK